MKRGLSSRCGRSFRLDEPPANSARLLWLVEECPDGPRLLPKEERLDGRELELDGCELELDDRELDDRELELDDRELDDRELDERKLDERELDERELDERDDPELCPLGGMIHLLWRLIPH